MHSLEITLQHPRHGSFPVVAEHRSSSALPARAEGQLLPTGAAADLDAFDTALLQLLDQPHDYGTLLGQALFRDQIRDRFMSACAAAGDAGLRVLLVVEAPALWPLRWERLCAPDGTGGWDFLALHQTTPFSRYLPSLSDRRFPAIGRRDLRALVLLAAPPEQNPFDLAPFDAEAMAAAIGDALGAIPHHRLGPVAGAIGPASLDALAQHLTQPRDSAGFTLLHIVAHGALRRDDGETLIHLLDDTGQVAPVTATELIRRLSRLGASRGLPHLCFLATCEGASPEAEPALGGLAQRLVRELGLPAVVAMTARVGIDTASMLTGPFYRQLRACGEPDRALVEAGAGLHGQADILVPALFARLAERPLFSTGIDIDRPLTPAELTHGLARLGALLAERAPVLKADFEQSARRLRATLPADFDALAEPARGERTQAIDALDALSLEVLDLGFPALALDEPVPDWDPRCPFPGLKAFQTDERAFFFGRQPLIDALTERLRRDRFLAVLGPSGSGKSSLVLAGLVPALLDDSADPPGATGPSPTGPYRYLTPGADPQAALARQLQSSPPKDTDTLLVIDQLEELFTLCTDPDRRAAFIADLTAAQATHPRLHLVLTMRADFWGDCAAHPQLKGPMQAHQELIAPMDTAELRAAMEQQAAATGLRFEADLSHRILAEVEGEPGAMPLLQHLLLQLWLRRHGRWLRVGEYQALGGIRQAIAHTADGICDRLIADQIADASLLRVLFIRLTRLDDPSATSSSPATSSPRRLVDDSERHRDTRQRVPLAELMSIDEQPQRVRRVVQRLADARLLMTSSATAANRPDSAVDDTQVEVSHEALIRYWPRLRDWIGDDREAWRLLADLGHDARKWQAAGEPDRDLPRWGERLRRAEALFAQPRFRPTDTERRFVAAARALDERERNEKAEREAARIAALERAANEQRRKTRIALIGAAVSALLLAVAVWLGTQSERARRDAVGQLASTHWKEAMVVRETEPLDALHWLALAARRFDEAKRPARRDNALLALKLINDQPLLHAILPHEGSVTGAEYSANGDRILSWSDDGTARLWDAATGAPVVPPMTHEARVYGARLSSDGSRILTWSRDNTARVWDADTGRPVTPPLGHDESVRGAQFTADGSAVLTWSFDDTARLWDATTGAPMTPPLAHNNIVNGAGFDADAARILTWSDDATARLWDAATGEAITPPLAHNAQVVGARFDADDSRVLTWSSDGTARLWDPATGEAITRALSHELVFVSQIPEPGSISSYHNWYMANLPGARFDAATGKPITSSMERNGEDSVAQSHAAGARIITWDEDGRPRFSGVATGMVLSPPLVVEGAVLGARFSADESRILTWAKDDTARLWDAATGDAVIPPLRHDGEVWGARFNADESRILTWSEDGSARLWDAATGRALTKPMAHERERLHGATFNGDESRILTWGEDGTARLWNAESGKPSRLPLAHDSIVYGARFSADESRILTWSADGTARLWDAETGLPMMPPLTHGDSVVGARFNADESRILTWSDDGTLRLWEAGIDAYVDWVAPHIERRSVGGTWFSGDGLRILTRDSRSTVRLWDTTAGKATTPSLSHEGMVSGAELNHDGSRILTWGRDGNVRLWDGVYGLPITPPMEHDGVEGAQLYADVDLILSWGRDGTARLWDATTGKEVAPPMAHAEQVQGARLSQRGDRVLTWSDDGTARVWDAATGEAVTPPLAHERRVDGAEFTADATRVLTWSDGTARVWDAATGEAITPPMNYESGNVWNGARFNRDGSSILTWGRSVGLWDATSGEAVVPPMVSEEWATGGAYFSADESRILAYSSSAARVWDAATGKAITPPMVPRGNLNEARFLADDSRIITWSSDLSPPVRLWDAATGDALGSPLAPGLSRAWPPEVNVQSGRILVWVQGRGLLPWDVSVDNAWPIHKTTLKVEAETGTRLAETGEIEFLSAEDWLDRRCEYDQIRRRLGLRDGKARITDAEWSESQRRCKVLDEAE